MAESYTVSEDHLLYTFKLRAGVKFHNGQEVTPEDVIWSYQRCGDANAPADIIQVAAFANVEMYQEGMTPSASSCRSPTMSLLLT